MRVEGVKPFRFVMSPTLHLPRAGADVREETRRLVDATNADISAMIRRAPDQWMWLHRRWKSEGGWK
jgi:lauroyl/myristoyl acyltransferase